MEIEMQMQKNLIVKNEVNENVFKIEVTITYFQGKSILYAYKQFSLTYFHFFYFKNTLFSDIRKQYLNLLNVYKLFFFANV